MCEIPTGCEVSCAGKILSKDESLSQGVDVEDIDVVGGLIDVHSRNG